MALLTFKVLSSSMPAYQSDLIQAVLPVPSLWSSNALLLSVPRTQRNSFGGRSGTHYPLVNKSYRTIHTYISKLICSASLNLKPLVPWYHTTLSCCTNTVSLLSFLILKLSLRIPPRFKDLYLYLQEGQLLVAQC